ncbi:MAG: extracellular solute-binding protein, partial [Armatimonadetes bacterium]|nr:extracellular solute-binding protein [Armatimonadota bacterium]
MRRGTRFLALLPLLLLSCLALSVERRTVTVWGMSLGPDSQGLQDVIREFERRNPQYRVRILSMGAGGMNPQKLMTAIVGKVPPDVIFQDRFSISDWASRGAFRPLDDLIERDKGRDPLTPTPDQYYPAFWQEACYGGKVYGIPASADTRALYWNKKVFRENAAAL